VPDHSLLLCVRQRSLHHIFSDPGRHWINGRRFFWPHIMGSIDPFMYQLWLRAPWFDRGTGYVVLAGQIFRWRSALMVQATRVAAAGARRSGFMPSLFMIYSYFTNETLLLTLLACGIWLRCARCERRTGRRC
jgi:hypothetical protein